MNINHIKEGLVSPVLDRNDNGSAKDLLLGKNEDLHERRTFLNIFLEKAFNVKAYFQVPESFHIKYPAIIYEIDSMKPVFSDNYIYNNWQCYNVTLISDSFDNALKGIEKLRAYIPYVRFVRNYTKDRFHYTVFKVYI